MTDAETRALIERLRVFYSPTVLHCSDEFFHESRVEIAGAIDAAASALEATLACAVPPREPTPEMCRVACDMALRAHNVEMWLDEARDYWIAMFDAAPAAAEPEASPADKLVATLLRMADMNGADTRTCRETAARLAAQEREIAELRARAEAAEAECARLRSALREHAMRCEPLRAGHWRYECLLCGGTWQTGADAERHAENCLAAPKDAP